MIDIQFNYRWFSWTALSLITVSAWAQTRPVVEMAALLNGQIVLQSGSARTVQITSTIDKKAFITFSPDGAKIAYVDISAANTSHRTLEIIDQKGGHIASFQIYGTIADYGTFDFNDVYSVRWITNSRVCLAGHVNPSLTHFYVFDLATRADHPTNDYVDDLGIFSISPEGFHIIESDGAPHFVPTQDTNPVVYIDHTALPIPVSDLGETVVRPIWSGDSSRVAWVSEGRDGVQRVFTWLAGSQNGTLSKSDISKLQGDATSLYWKDSSQLILKTVGDDAHSQTRFYLVNPKWISESRIIGNGSIMSLDREDGPEPLNEARLLYKSLVAEALKDGFKQADFWCNHCSLSMLPYGAPRLDIY